MTRRPSHHVPIYGPTLSPYRPLPAAYVKGEKIFSPTSTQKRKGYWVQGDNLRPVPRHKKYYHFIWPKDGKNGSTWGRVKDILRGEGPDMYVTVSADKRDYMWNRPRRPRWANHLDEDFEGVTPLKNPCWVTNGLVGGRPDKDKRYDFYSRQYRKPWSGMYRDILYEGPNGESWPSAVRDIYGNWYQDVAGWRQW